MSELRTDTITASDGTSPVTLTKQSAAKMWANLDGLTFGLKDSFNTSSATDHSTGNYSIVQTSVFSNATYVCQSSGGRNAGDLLGINNNDASYPRTTSTVRTEVDRSTSDNQYDATNVDQTRFGDLA